MANVSYSIVGLNRDDQIYIDTFVDVLSKHSVKPWTYSIGKNIDGAVCLSKENGKYVVYIGERGERFVRGEYDDVDDACLKMVSDMPYLEKDDENAIVKDMLRAVKKRYTSSYTFNPIKNALNKVATI